MNAIQWVRGELNPRQVTSDDLIYQQQESQSNHSLPIIYEPFNAKKRTHWRDRGATFDFLAAAGDGRLLDLGPGDGWPSLTLAPLVGSVTGVDASDRRTQVCLANAQRMGIFNFRATTVPAGQPLPFADESFDGAVAASAIEQTPNPRATLQELHRVLRPGGHLRIWYESVAKYRGGQEQDLTGWSLDAYNAYLLLADRRVDEERMTYYGLRIAAPIAKVEEQLGLLAIDRLTPARLEELRPLIVDAAQTSLALPGCRTFMTWLREAGFRTVTPTYWGGWFAERLYESLGPDRRPHELADLDRLLRPTVSVAVQMEAPVRLDPPITAVK